MKMKKLVIVRHGDYDFRGHLTDRGIRMVEGLVNNLHPYLEGPEGLEMPIVVLSSPASFAWQSAAIIATRFDVLASQHPELYSEHDSRPRFSDILTLLRISAERASTVIIVTHLEIAENFPQHFANRELDRIELKGWDIERGEAWLIDCETKTMIKVSHGEPEE